MKPTRAVEQFAQEEFKNLLPVIIWQNEDKEYEVFGHYTVIVENPRCSVFINNDLQGVFNSTRTAISWCIADKYKKYNLAREILSVDNMLANITNDIFVRAGVANKTRDPVIRESIELKLEPKILHKKSLKSQLDKCVNWAKYLHQKGFENEAPRPGTAAKVKTNISGV
jgi:hypothetical protein